MQLQREGIIYIHYNTIPWKESKECPKHSGEVSPLMYGTQASDFCKSYGRKEGM
jgi:hypothetical protein